MLCEAVQSSASARAALSHDRTPWSDEDEAVLAAMHLMEPPAPPERIAAMLGRSMSSVVTRASILRLRKTTGSKLRRCMNHRESGHTIYSTWAGDRYCYPCRQKLQELF